ncbi:MAG: putative transcriptional regulator, TetR family [Rhizobium sp.]|nr:putative transcriptional regulator, TetR family [Rhizobium sp.]
MQDKTRRSNTDRSQATRASLLNAGRELFVKMGYAETATPDIAAAAHVTRGALYHHFSDKASLFEAVIRREASAVAEAIAEATRDIADPMISLEEGADAYLDAMALFGRTRLLLIDGPAVLGRELMDRIDRESPASTLVAGLAAATGRPVDASLEALSSLLSAAFDRAALDIGAGAAPAPYRQLLKQLLVIIPSVLLPDGI